MTDIQFAKEHMGEYFRCANHLVRVIGYDATEPFGSVIIDHPAGWRVVAADPSDFIREDLCETGRCRYVNWEALKDLTL